ncbi:accessory factor UbiK family protein [Paenalcaligenes niemegkensis]|uniref:accessory factor UbiK family protein n=1 Tax=Paenalcaligenes niemegkensis TaxID=2895469 RepID=UPI001EE93A85|nr:accessory factor UbiK family protein [Paenalcaligenes niemegkensis]MCQ9616470.1 accessory factor UbiK family protein [Paenalcaligenes niemegkensis]
MNPRTDWFNELQKNISELIAKSPAADIEKNVRALMSQTFTRMDLLTREEFENQSALLERALVRITTLESRVQALEAKLNAKASAGQPDSDSSPS